MKTIITLILTSSLLFFSCNKEEINDSIQSSTIEASQNGRRGGTFKCPPSYITVTPCYNKFKFQLHYSNGIISGWPFGYTLTNSSGTVIDAGSGFHGDYTVPSSLVTPCQTYTLQFTGCSINPNTVTLQSDGCGGLWNC